MHTALAPEPRDVHWGNLMLSSYSITLRQFLVLVATVLLLLFWSTPVFFLASLLSFDTVKKYSPWLAKQIDHFPAIGALVQNSLPSLAFIGFNALLPYILEALCYFQGLRAKSWIEYSLLKKYYIFLLITYVDCRCLLDKAYLVPIASSSFLSLCRAFPVHKLLEVVDF
jgi:hypothetical protein